MSLQDIRAVEPFWQAIRDEALALASTDHIAMPYAGGYEGDWGVFLLTDTRWLHEYPGVDIGRNRARCPRTIAALELLGDLRLAGFLRLAAGARILPHTDKREDDELRAHLGLQLAPRETWWPEGTWRLLDIREEHAAHNDGDRDRITLVVDVGVQGPWPAVPPWDPS